MNLKILWAAFAATAALGMAACEKQGPVERAGEEVDEAVDTIKNGGEESTASKVDDALDEARDKAKDAAEDAKQK
jgi:predicted aconitase